MSSAAPEVEKRRRRPKFPRPAGVGHRLGMRGAARHPPAAAAGVRRRLPASWTAARVLAGAVLGALILAGLLAAPIVGWIGLKGPSVHDPNALNVFGNPAGPSSTHPLGVDAEGRDVLSRLLFGLRSFVLLSLAGAAIGLLIGQALYALAQLRRWLRLPVYLLCSGLGAFPALLLGLALGLSLGPGVWRMILAIALASLAAAGDRRDLGPLALRALANAMLLDFGLTFLGDGPGGDSPQLGAGVAHAGLGIIGGVPAWWALLFPGLVVMLAVMAARGLAGEPSSRDRLGRPVRVAPRTPLGYVADQLITAVLALAVVAGFAAIGFSTARPPGSARATGGGGLHALLADLPGTISLLVGGAIVWALLTLTQVWLATRPGRVSRLSRAHAERGGPTRRRDAMRDLGALMGAVIAAAPIGWLAFLAIYLFSESIGKLSILPGAASYVGLTHDPARWAHGLLMPWLLLGLSAAAAMAPGVSGAVLAAAQSGQQRVARAAGVPPRPLTRQLRRALLGPVLELSARWLGAFLGAAVVVEASFVIPGAGAQAVSDFGYGRAAPVTDLTVLAAAVGVIYAVAVNLARLALDPRVAD